MPASATFGAQLRETRERAKLSQSALAAQLGVTRNYISAMEAGGEVPSLARVKQIHRALVAALYGNAPAHAARRIGVTTTGDLTTLLSNAPLDSPARDTAGALLGQMGDAEELWLRLEHAAIEARFDRLARHLAKKAEAIRLDRATTLDRFYSSTHAASLQ